MSKIIEWQNGKAYDLEADAVLQMAMGELKEVVVIGWTNDGNMWLGGSKARSADVLWLLENCKQSLFE